MLALDLAVPVPGLFVTGTDTGVGKTVIAAAIARWFSARNRRTAVLKPVASGCEKRREGLVSEDAELLAFAADTPHPLDLVCPVRFTEPVAPSVAARRSQREVDWSLVARSVAIMSADADVMIIEGAGGVYTPLSDTVSNADLAAAMRVPAVVVARATLGTINHTLLTIRALATAGVATVGVIINRYPTDLATTAEETAPAEIERLSGLPVLALVPDEPFTPPVLPPGIMSAVDQVDWVALAACNVRCS